MRTKETIRQAPAYKPTRTMVQRALDELKRDDLSLRNLVLESAALREFDAELLGHLAEREADGQKLVDEIELYVPLEPRGKDSYRYDQFTREALFEAIEAGGEEALLRRARQVAVAYYRKLAAEASKKEKPRFQDQVLYYRLLADPQSGLEAWQKAWTESLQERHVLKRRAELIRLAEEAWSELSAVPGAQPAVLVRKGWLAYDNSDWQVALTAFWKLLTANPDPGPRERALYRLSPRAASLIDGTVDRFLEARTNLGLGYVNYRLGALAEAAQHFQKAVRLIGSKPPAEGQAALNRAKALCGLGEVCTRMGTPESMLLRRRLLPGEEQRKTLVESARASETPPLEDLALNRLLKEAEKRFENALKTLESLEEGKPREETRETVEPKESIEGSRLRIQARQAFLFLQQGDWQGARVKFEEVRRRELERLGAGDERRALERLSADDGRGELLARDRRTIRRLGWINLHLGDCCLLATGIPPATRTDVPEEPAHSSARQSALAGDLLERMAKRRQAEPDEREPQVCDEKEAEARALGHYRTAKLLWKRINNREGQALALRRQADVAALQIDEPGRRREALHLYATSLAFFERLDLPFEVLRAQERIELLLARARPPEESDAPSEPAMAVDAPEIEESPVEAGAAPGDSAWPEFQREVEKVLARRPRFFRYRLARKLERRLQRIYRLNVVLATLLLFPLLCGWLVWLAAPWLSQLSARVVGLPWALPALGIVWLVLLIGLVVQEFPFVRRLAVGVIPLRWFWLEQDQIAVDDAGLHLHDHTGQRKQFIGWRDVWEVRSQTWDVGGESGGQAAVFGPTEDVLRFDHHLRGYGRLLRAIKQRIAATGYAERWKEPRRAPMAGWFLLLGSFSVLNVAVFITAGLTVVLALIPAITRFGPVCFGIEAAFLAYMALLLSVLRYREYRYLHPLRKQIPPMVEMSEL
jgi:hypothetical protein